jgi:hypothetical protein
MEANVLIRSWKRYEVELSTAVIEDSEPCVVSQTK